MIGQGRGSWKPWLGGGRSGHEKVKTDLAVPTRKRLEINAAMVTREEPRSCLGLIGN
jgi:hypothetical protein